MAEYSHDNELLYVAPDEAPPDRHPPITEIGPIGWVRNNLFHTWFDTVQTMITFALVIYFLSSFITWVVQSAQWGIVTNNLGLLMLGSRYPQDEVQEAQIVGAIVVALAGLSYGVWARFSWTALIIGIAVLILLIGLPTLASAIDPAPVRLLVQDNGEFGPLMFIGDEGQNIQLSVEPITSNEPALAEEAAYEGYIENNTFDKSTSSRTRWNDNVRTQVQRGNLDLSHHSLRVNVRLYDSNHTLLEEITVSPDLGYEPIDLELPEDGWYTIEAESAITTALFPFDGVMLPQQPPGVAWVRLDGVVPYSPRRSATEARLEQYGEMPAYDCPRETVECRIPVSEVQVRFEGDQSVGQYIQHQLTPMTRAIRDGLIVAALLFVGGWGLGHLLRRTGSKYVEIGTIAAWVAAFPIGWLILASSVSPTNWGGLLLTMVLTIVAVTASFPIGLLLALGRRSDLQSVSMVSTLLIEVVRGVPLITILFMAQWVVPGIWEGLRNKELILMMSGLTIFTAAYTAEIVRGGLQIIPTGQYEAARAVGLSGMHTSLFIVLPQALRAVIPALMGQFISIFKDTTLVSIVSIRLYELLRASRDTIGSEVYAPYKREVFLFIGVIYFVVSYGMSAISRRLEETGAGATRRKA